MWIVVLRLSFSFGEASDAHCNPDAPMRLTAAILFLTAATMSGGLDAWQPVPATVLAISAAAAVWWLSQTRNGAARTVSVGVSALCLAVGVFTLLPLIGAPPDRWPISLTLADRERQRLAMEEAFARSAAETAERERREAEEIAALRGANPDKYLARLKQVDPVKWREEFKALRPKESAAYEANIRREQQESAELALQRKRPLDYLTLTHNSRKEGFGVVMVASFTVKSALQFAVKDIVIGCIGYAPSGTKLNELATTVYEIVPAKSTKQFSNVNMGFMSAQTASASCQILRADPV